MKRAIASSGRAPSTPCPMSAPAPAKNASSRSPQGRVYGKLGQHVAEPLVDSDRHEGERDNGHELPGDRQQAIGRDHLRAAKVRGRGRALGQATQLAEQPPPHIDDDGDDGHERQGATKRVEEGAKQATAVPHLAGLGDDQPQRGQSLLRVRGQGLASQPIRVALDDDERQLTIDQDQIALGLGLSRHDARGQSIQQLAHHLHRSPGAALGRHAEQRNAKDGDCPVEVDERRLALIGLGVRHLGLGRATRRLLKVLREDERAAQNEQSGQNETDRAHTRDYGRV